MGWLDSWRLIREAQGARDYSWKRTLVAVHKRLRSRERKGVRVSLDVSRRFEV